MDFIASNELKLIAILIIFALSVLLLLLKKKKINNTKPLIQPVKDNGVIFVDLSPKSADLIELSIEIWRIQNRLIKASSKLEDAQKRGLESSVQKLFKYLDRFHIKIVDHTDQKYNEGLSVDVLSFENDSSVSVPTIKETIEPTIICENIVVKKGKVVVIKNN
jgi:hypothetical protein